MFYLNILSKCLNWLFGACAWYLKTRDIYLRRITKMGIPHGWVVLGSFNLIQSISYHLSLLLEGKGVIKLMFNL